MKKKEIKGLTMFTDYTDVKMKDTFKNKNDLLSHYAEIDETARLLKQHLFNVTRKDLDETKRLKYAREIDIIMIILNETAKAMKKLILNKKK